MYTLIDIGHTRIKVGHLSEKGEVLTTFSIPSKNFNGIYSSIKEPSLGKTLISSVLEVPAHVLGYLSVKSETLNVLDWKTSLPLKSRYTTPKTGGPDRLALACGANWLFPSKNTLVVSAGTCITYELVTSKKEYLGGAISPGLYMRANAMHQYTTTLPLVEINPKVAIVGNSTSACLESGVLHGVVMEMRGFIDAIASNHKGLQIVLTGGDGPLLAPFLAPNIYQEPNLSLLGLYAIARQLV